jgi:hypothetical protein
MIPKTFEEYDAQSELKGKGFVLTFGKYEAFTLKAVLKCDPQYLVWLNNSNVIRLKKKLLKKARQKACHLRTYRSRGYDCDRNRGYDLDRNDNDWPDAYASDPDFDLGANPYTPIMDGLW